jgi:hypothetical protein
LELGELEGARTALAAAAELWQRAGDRSDLAECLELFASIAAHGQEPARAIRLAAAAASLRVTAGTAPSPAEAERHAAVLVRLRHMVDSHRFTAEWDDGAAMTTDEAVALAIG